MKIANEQKTDINKANPELRKIKIEINMRSPNR